MYGRDNEERDTLHLKVEVHLVGLSSRYEIPASIHRQVPTSIHGDGYGHSPTSIHPYMHKSILALLLGAPSDTLSYMDGTVADTLVLFRASHCWLGSHIPAVGEFSITIFSSPLRPFLLSTNNWCIVRPRLGRRRHICGQL